MVKVLIGFLVGVAVGVAGALLLAPSSGEELRNQMHDYADTDMERMRAEYRRGMDSLHSRVDKMSKDMDTAAEVDVEETVDVTLDESAANAA